MLRRRNEFKDRYDRFHKELRDEILSGRIRPGEFIMPENTLSEKYGISRVSVRKVLAELVEEGLIEKIAGKGNRVVEPAAERKVETLQIAWFTGSYEIEIVRRMIERFERQHPFVRLELVLLPEIGYTDTLLHLMEHGQGPDVFMMSDLHFREWVASGKTDWLSGYVPPHLESESYPEVFSLFSHAGRMLAAPFVFSPVVICYNRSILQRNGIDEPVVESWDDLLRIASRCTGSPNADGIVDQYGFCFSSSMNRWPVFLLQNGGRFLSEDGARCVMAQPENVEALDFCVQLMYKHQVSPIYSHGSTYLAEQLFVKERVAMILTTYYFMNEFRDHPIQWDVLNVPKAKTRETLLLGGGLAVNARSGKEMLARQVVDFMTGAEAQTMLKRHGCTIPALRQVAEDENLLDPAIHPPHYRRYLDALPGARPLSSLGLDQSAINLLFDELNLVWANMERPEHACKRIEQLMNAALPI